MTTELDRREGHGKTGHAWFQTDPHENKDLRASSNRNTQEIVDNCPQKIENDSLHSPARELEGCYDINEIVLWRKKKEKREYLMLVCPRTSKLKFERGV